jgi:hypothetical protein
MWAKPPIIGCKEKSKLKVVENHYSPKEDIIEILLSLNQINQIAEIIWDYYKFTYHPSWFGLYNYTLYKINRDENYYCCTRNISDLPKEYGINYDESVYYKQLMCQIKVIRRKYDELYMIKEHLSIYDFVGLDLFENIIEFYNNYGQCVYTISLSFFENHVEDIVQINNKNNFIQYITKLYYRDYLNKHYFTVHVGRYTFDSMNDSKMKMMDELWQIWTKIFGPIILRMNKKIGNLVTEF